MRYALNAFVGSLSTMLLVFAPLSFSYRFGLGVVSVGEFIFLAAVAESGMKMVSRLTDHCKLLTKFIENV